MSFRTSSTVAMERVAIRAWVVSGLLSVVAVAVLGQRGMESTVSLGFGVNRDMQAFSAWRGMRGPQFRGEQAFLAHERKVPRGRRTFAPVRSQELASNELSTTAPDEDADGALFRRGIPRLAQPYRSWAGDRPWMKYKDYKEMSAIKRLKFAEQRQSGVMKAILRAPKGAPNFGSLFPEGESDEAGSSAS